MFVLALPFSIRLQFILASGIYILGALVFKSISGKISEIDGKSGFAYNAIITLEEACEMLGAIVFIFAFLQYLAKNFGELQISFRPFFKSESLREDTDSKDLINFAIGKLSNWLIRRVIRFSVLEEHPLIIKA